jgi:hypothetical protein
VTALASRRPERVAGLVDQATAILDLARRIERLAPHHRDPERFHEDKSEIVASLRRLAKEVRHG